MSMRGNLRDMAVADLIQHNCQDHKTTRVRVQHGSHEAALFFKDGRLVHAALEGRGGEEVVYQILAWNEGTFDQEAGLNPPTETITRSWSALLLEGARLLDQARLDPNINGKADSMAPKLRDMLAELGAEVSGYTASAVVGMDGLSIADHAKSAKTNPEATSAQLALLLKLVDSSTVRMNAGAVEDNLLSTDSAYVLMRFLPGKDYFLGVAVDRKAGNLGNLRLMSKLFVDRIAKAMPR